MFDIIEKEKIDRMPLGDLVHYLIANYHKFGDEAMYREPHWQNSYYLYALEKLNQIHERIMGTLSTIK